MKERKNGAVEPVWLAIIRILLGLIFVFSSTVKGIDPVGTAYRVEDYLVVFGWTNLLPYSIYIAFLVIISEFILGIAFLFKTLMRIAIPGMFLMMSFFTVVTLFDAINNWVPDCGCFGDAVKLSNWHTFYKNVVIISLNVIFVLKINIYALRKCNARKTAALFLTGILFTGFVIYNYNHLPVIDFRNWKEGRDMKTGESGKEKIYVIYKNKKSGEIKEFLSPDYPWNDSVWMSQWEFVDQRADDSQVVKKYDLQIEDSSGTNVTKDIIESPDYQFIIVSYYLGDGSEKGFEKLPAIVDYLNTKGVNVVLLTASENSNIKAFLKRYRLNVDTYFADDIQLKAMIRSNPGLILLKNGVVLKKWHYNDFPGVKQLDQLLKDE